MRIYRHQNQSYSRHSRLHSPDSHRGRGFALVELLVAAAILGIAASSALLLFGALSDRLAIRNLSYSLALSLRQAQSYGISVRGASETAFDAGYGIHFDAGSDATFVLFADTDGNERFTGAFGIEYNETGCLAGDECLEVSRVERVNRVEKFCAVRAVSGSEECSTDSPPLVFLDISFHRPDPDAIIRTNFSVGDPGRYQRASIRLISPRGTVGRVEVWTTGQISVK